MSITTVLFDLDGTLLPMDQDAFTKGYFKLLAKKLLPYGYEPQKLINSIWSGTEAMVKNDGSVTNETAFWARFAEIYGEKANKDKPIFEDFYAHDFQLAKQFCGYNPEAAKTVYELISSGLRIALATNPIFPSYATESRIGWAGLKPSDFEHYTTYENSRFSKPNLNYYRQIMYFIGVEPQECIMVGNDVGEDMVAAKLGMKVFLLTDCLINKADEDISIYPNGSFAELREYISTNR